MRINSRFEWTDYAVLFCGVWLLTNPATQGYTSPAIIKSDLISGSLAIFFALLSITSKSNLFRWMNCLVGLWLTFAPILFWAPSAAAYSNDTLFGCIIISCTAFHLGRSLYSDRLNEIPVGWNYNPSKWAQRLPIIGLAYMGYLSARYLAAYQLGHIDTVWDPFFGKGTATILKSEVSQAFPVSDAGLGAFSYLLDALSGGIGDHRRWRTMPWMVVLFGIMIVPPGITSITLIILQPIAVGSWCTLCLFTAMIMLVMVPPAIDEVIASIQFLLQSKKAGRPFWRTFFKGDQPEKVSELVALPSALRMSENRILNTTQLRWKCPWSLVLSAAIGTWLMFVPTTLDLSSKSYVNTYIVAALVVTFSIVSLPEVGRPFRWALTLLGTWLLLASFVLPGAESIGRINGAFCGMLITLLSFFQGPIRHSYGAYDRWILWSPIKKAKNISEDQRDVA